MTWQELLHQKVQELGRRNVEAELGISRTTLSLVLNNKYKETKHIEALVMEAYGTLKVVCPVMGEISKKRCTRESKMPNTLSNPIRARIYRACRTCPNNKANK
jgi:hypothetical protein